MNTAQPHPPTALVTGASSGLGAAFAEALQRAGYAVVATSRNPHQPGLPDSYHWLALDAASPDQLTEFVESHGDLLDSLGVLVNNAGAGHFADLAELSDEQVRGGLHLLLQTPIALTKRVIPGMRTRGTGTIVNVSSLAALFPLPYFPVYNAAKSGLSAFTQSLLMTEEPAGVQIIDFQPGDFRTAFNARVQRQEHLNGNQAIAWRELERQLAKSPLPARAAADLMRAIRSGRSGTVRSGGLFQRLIAPLGARLLPRRCLLAAIRRYYRISMR